MVQLFSNLCCQIVFKLNTCPVEIRAGKEEGATAGIRTGHGGARGHTPKSVIHHAAGDQVREGRWGQTHLHVFHFLVVFSTTANPGDECSKRMEGANDLHVSDCLVLEPLDRRGINLNGSKRLSH